MASHIIAENDPKRAADKIHRLYQEAASKRTPIGYKKWPQDEIAVLLRQGEAMLSLFPDHNLSPLLWILIGHQHYQPNDPLRDFLTAVKNWKQNPKQMQPCLVTPGFLMTT